MTKRVHLFNGPNLNFLGKRQTDIYGNVTLEDVTKTCERIARSKDMSLKCFQTNYEGQLIDWVQASEIEADAIVINPGAYSHTSIALLDALNAFKGLVIEVHISNIHAREDFRHKSFISIRADGIIMGLGVLGYELALEAVDRLSA